MVGLRDRRSSKRHPVVENGARMRWREGREIRESPAQLMDITRGGALLIAYSPPPLFQVVEFRLERPTETGWVGGFVARRDDVGRVGVVLHHLIPPYFYEIAISGKLARGFYRIARRPISGRSAARPARDVAQAV
jgi:hypothetical protein